MPQYERHDLIFRKVRGILNKITPEKFHKLSDELIGLGLNSTYILKGVILLIFEKALEETKYSSMYAQLCKKLSEEVPNFDKVYENCEPNQSNPYNRSTFCRLLLLKCKDEFENRKKATDDFGYGPLSDEDEEARAIAKHKMLGNIKFICELGKQKLVREPILHVCIQQLCKKKADEPLANKAEDLECLFQIMKTIGCLLDTVEARSLMDQYFKRIEKYSTSTDLPSRIRFMLQDVIELRANKWVPRRIQREQNPKTINQIRAEAAKELASSNLPMNGVPPHLGLSYGQGVLYGSPNNGGFILPHSTNYRPESFGSLQPNPLMFGETPAGQRTLDDYFASPMSSIYSGINSLGTGPGVISVCENVGVIGSPSAGTSVDSGNFNQRRPNNNYNNNNNNVKNMNKNNNNNYRSQENRAQTNNRNRLNQQTQHVTPNGSRQELPPRFQRRVVPQQSQSLPVPMNHQNQQNNQRTMVNSNSNPNVGNVNSLIGNENRPLAKPLGLMNSLASSESGEISLRPINNSMLVKPNIGGLQNKNQAAVVSNTNTSNVTLKLMESRNPYAIPLSNNGSTDGKNGDQLNSSKAAEKNKQDAKETAIKFTQEMVSDLIVDKVELNEIVNKFSEKKLPKNVRGEVIVTILKATLDKGENDREKISDLLAEMKRKELYSNQIFISALKSILTQLTEMELEVPRVKSHVAGFIARAIVDNIVDLRDVYNIVEGGHHYPLILLVLQTLHQTKCQDWLYENFTESKINLIETLPEIDRRKERLTEILCERGLSFLYPLLRIESDLAKYLTSTDCTPNSLFKWLKDNVDTSVRSMPGFVQLLFTSIVKFIVEKTKQPPNESSAGSSTNMNELEKELLNKYRPVLIPFLHDKPTLQLIVLYSLQSYWLELGSPKEMLLRWFMLLYDLEIVEDEVFIQWKEDINDQYPGKGQALFQVNKWFEWLEKVDEDDDDGDDGSGSESK